MRIVLPHAVGASREEAETVMFIDAAGEAIAVVPTSDVWMFADHDPLEDVPAELKDAPEACDANS